MDTSFWTQLNPKIVCESTRKQFYSQFCYKLVIEAYGARSIVDAEPNKAIADHIAIRKSKLTLNNRYRSSWSGSGWQQQNINDLNKADPTMLEEIRSIKNGYDNRIRVRIEEPWVQIYTKDLTTLEAVTARLTYDKANTTRLMSVSVPESIEHQSLLEQGKILTRPSSKLEYSYKIVLRDGTYGTETKTRVADYFKSIGDTVKVSKSNMSMLEGHLKFIWGCFLYTDDPAVATMISLIAPGMVGKIHEIVKL